LILDIPEAQMRPDRNLENRDSQRRNKNDRSHVSPRQVDVPGDVTMELIGENRIKPTLQKCVLQVNSP
jgi:hypothetical protein